MADLALSPNVSAMLELPRSDLKRMLRELGEAAVFRLLHDFQFWARSEQIWRPREDVRFTWMIPGRGWGKTAAGTGAAHAVAAEPWHCGAPWPEDESKVADQAVGVGGVMGIAGRTASDVNETMLYGPSGIMTLAPPWFRPEHNPSKKRLTWPNGCRARLFSGDVPDSFRGPNFGFFLGDEVFHWAKIAECLEMIRMGLRHGQRTHALFTSTPLPVQVLIEMIWQCDESGMPVALPDGSWKLRPKTAVVTGSTYDNAANLAEDYIEDVSSFEGTEVGNQELHGEIMLGGSGKIFSYAWFRRCEVEAVPDLEERILAIDPSNSDEKSKSKDRSECGIADMGLGVDRRLYAFEDLSGEMTDREWAQLAIRTYLERGLDRIVCEDNNGGSLVETVIRAQAPSTGRRIRIDRVRATKSKYARMRLVSHLWEAGSVFHVGDPRKFVRVERQLTTADPAKKPQPLDRADAWVWGALGLANDGSDRTRAKALGRSDVWASIREGIARRKR